MGSDYFLLHIFTHCLMFAYGKEIPKMDTDKPILRYGFQRTKECQDFQRAYLCVRKCMELHYDVAHTDKNCVCTCFQRKDKAKYTPVIFGKTTKWRLGAPTTSVPAWAKQHNQKLSGQGYLGTSHEMGAMSEEHGYIGNGTLVDLGKPTASGVEDGTSQNSTVVEGANNSEAGNSTDPPAVNTSTAADVSTTVAATT